MSYRLYRSFASDVDCGQSFIATPNMPVESNIFKRLIALQGNSRYGYLHVG